MKEFIYLDTDYITSVLAQINNGKLSGIVEGTGNIKQDTQTEDTTINVNSSKLKIGIPNIINVDIGNDKTISDAQNTLSKIESATQILTKTFDDNIYDILINSLNDKHLITEEIAAGSYVNLSNEFKILDFNYILTLLNDDFISLYTSGDDIINSLNRDQRRDKNIQQNIKNLKNSKKLEYENTRKIISVAKSICPTDSILSTKNIIAPLKNDFLRASYSEINFKYKDNIRIFAKITRRFSIICANESSDKILNATNCLLPDLLKPFNIELNNDTYIATPIAIYCE